MSNQQDELSAAFIAKQKSRLEAMRREHMYEERR